MKIKIKSYSDDAIDFQDEEMPKENFNHPFLPVKSLDSILKNDENCYMQVFSKECKHIEKGDWAYYWWFKKFFWFWYALWRITFLQYIVYKLFKFFQ